MVSRASYNSRSQRQIQSVANPTIYRHAPRDPAKPDTRGKGPGRGEQGIATCPVCGAEVTLRKARSEDVGLEARIAFGDLLLSQHRVGGGRYSARRGDARCKGSGLPLGEERTA